MKKLVKILIPIIILIVFLIVLFSVIIKSNDFEIKKEKFIYELGEEVSSDLVVYLKDADIIKDISKYSLKSDSLKIKDKKLIKDDHQIIPVGEYKMQISYKKKNKDFIIAIVDKTSPEFTKSKEIIEVEENTKDIDMLSYFEVKDLSKTELSILGDYDLNKVGEYKLKIHAQDEYNNSSEIEFILKVNAKKVIEQKVEPNKNTSVNKSYNKTNSNSTNNSSSQQHSNNTNNNSTSGYKRDVAASYVNQVNAYRRANGLSELPVTSEAQAEADRRAKELVTNYSHDGSGYGFGEVIGNGSVGADFITAWKQSPPHNAALLREQNVAIAASVYEHNNYWYAIITFRMNY